MQIEQTNQDMIQEQLPEEKPVNIPDPEYVSPAILTSRNANKKVASHLEFLKQLSIK